MELVGKGATQEPAGPPATKNETAQPAAAKAEAPAAAKASDFERLAAMLKSMGLGLHKLDVPATTAPKAKEATPKSAEPEKPVVAAKASAAASAPGAASLPAQPVKAAAVAEAERAPAPEAARGEAKTQVEASRASVASSASASASAAARQAPIADMRTCAPPTYPPKAHAANETGTVQVALLVAGDGRVIDSKVQKSSGSSELDKAARKAFSQCRFKVAGDDKDADPVWARLEYVFSLD
jgi:TonB family protein